MSQDRTLALALKKQRLLFRSAALRQSLAQDALPLQPLFHGADRVMDGVHWLKARPQVLAAATVVLVVLRPGRVLRWGRRAYFTWQALRGLSSRLDSRLGSRFSRH